MSQGKEITLLAQLNFAEPVDEAVLGELKTLVAKVRQEPGCVDYAAHVDAAAGQTARRVLFYERWQDQAALDVHMAAPALGAFVAVIGPRLTGAPELTFLTRLA